MIKNLLLLSLFISVVSCNKNLNISSKKSSISYLALGDSYTIGESVAENERWPVQLASKLSNSGFDIKSPRIIAKTGWTTDELKDAINNANITETYDLVSLLIGVNNQYRGRSLDQYKIEFEALLQRSISFAGDKAENVFAVSIPDYGVTPFAQSRNPTKIGQEVDEFNKAQKEICTKYKVAFYDITPYSKTALSQSDLVASDGLHPSGKMYSGWVDIFFNDVLKKLQ